MWWIALHLPLLSLESFSATLLPSAPELHGVVGEMPIALMDAHHIVSANAAAQALGVTAGLKRATALALAPHLTLGQADAARDAHTLQGVAHAALAFTPAVAIEPADESGAAPHTVLLEAEASLRYFGGRARLLRRLHAALLPLGHRVQCASAPTATGAAWLARVPQARDGRHAGDLAVLNRLLDALPVGLPGAAREHAASLHGMGLRVLSDLQPLPRSGLARRFGEALLDDVDRARGVRPDPRTWIDLPEHFSSRLELFARADTTEQVLHGASLLLARLVAWASAQHAQIGRFALHMQHEPRHRHDARTPADTTLEIALAEPSRDAAHLLVLLRERLAQVQLVAPTLELQLNCADIVCRAPPNGELFPSAQSEREGLTRLIERLQARLGPEQVQRLVPLEDHRVELATACMAVQPGSAPATRPRAPHEKTPADEPETAGLPRPVWLLPQPEPLPEKHARPLLDGQPLQLLCGPERIEAGWWDAGLAERDYFIAQAQDGALVWIYRARLPRSASVQDHGWFLQGRFG